MKKLCLTPATIKHVLPGYDFFDPSQLRDAPPSIFSQRELDIVLRLANGQPNKQIAFNLKLAISTMDYHRRKIREKLRIPKQIDLVSMLIRWTAFHRPKVEPPPRTVQEGLKGNMHESKVLMRPPSGTPSLAALIYTQSILA